MFVRKPGSMVGTVESPAWLIKRIAWRMQANHEDRITEHARQRARELACDADPRLYGESDMCFYRRQDGSNGPRTPDFQRRWISGGKILHLPPLSLVPNFLCLHGCWGIKRRDGTLS